MFERLHFKKHTKRFLKNHGSHKVKRTSAIRQAIHLGGQSIIPTCGNLPRHEPPMTSLSEPLCPRVCWIDMLPSIKKCRQNVKDSTVSKKEFPKNSCVKSRKKGIHFKHSNIQSSGSSFLLCWLKKHLAPQFLLNELHSDQAIPFLGAPHSEGKGLGDQHFKIQVGHPGRSAVLVGSHLYRGCWWEHIYIYIIYPFIKPFSESAELTLLTKFLLLDFFPNS